MKFVQTSYTTGWDISAIVDSDINLSRMIPKSLGTVDATSGKTIVKAGTVFPANDATAIGLVRWDYDVTHGDCAGAVMVFGFVNQDKLPTTQTISEEAKTALNKITFWKESIIAQS